MKSMTGLQSWLQNNAWNLIATAIAIILAFAALNARVDAIEKKVAGYPSQDWFSLKFQQIDNSINGFNTKLEKHVETMEDK